MFDLHPVLLPLLNTVQKRKESLTAEPASLTEACRVKYAAAVSPETKTVLTVRDQFAMHAPIDFDVARRMFGGNPNLSSKEERAEFFAYWSKARYEFADAMIEAAIKDDKE